MLQQAISFLQNRKINIKGDSIYGAIDNWAKNLEDKLLSAAKFSIIWHKGFPVGIYTSGSGDTRVAFSESEIFIIDLSGSPEHCAKLRNEASKVNIPTIDFWGSTFCDLIDSGKIVAKL